MFWWMSRPVLIQRQKPYLAMIAIQLIGAGSHLLSKAAFNHGLNTFVFTFYRQAIATAVLLPVTILVLRSGGAPRLSARMMSEIFLFALLGITLTLNLYGVGLHYTTATLVAASVNTIPVLTFVWSTLLRTEVVNVRSLPGKAKLAGVLTCIGGIVTVVVYKGPQLQFWEHLHGSRHETEHGSFHSNKRWALGTFLITLCNTAWPLCVVLQGRFLKKHSFPNLLFTTLLSVFSTVQSFFVAIAFERDLSHWKLGLNGLITVAYCGMVVSGVGYYLQTWCLHEKGPVFIAMFSPLSLLITALLSGFFLGEVIHLGSVLGGVLMVLALYCVLWGKSKEEKGRKLAEKQEKSTEIALEEGKSKILPVEESNSRELEIEEAKNGEIRSEAEFAICN
ncbi:WAT1-related protein At5g64700-like [Aristolochia californica]|uniref:WAT1-related protein At5g64700-like n=1 Tax=Aristolochia californica TaxID=171875 RepID=UPI0035D54F8F